MQLLVSYLKVRFKLDPQGVVLLFHSLESPEAAAKSNINS